MKSFVKIPSSAKKVRAARGRFNTPVVFAFIMAFALIGVATLILTQAASLPGGSFEPESGSASGNATKLTGVSGASNSGAVKFTAPVTGFDPHAILPPGSALPSDATCAARVTPAAEIRPQLASRNSVAGTNKHTGGTYTQRVSGAFTGSTDEILQWTACKWGIDADIVRAQAAKESYWSFGLGDWTTNASLCSPTHQPGVDGRPGECPESYGILQVRYQYHGPPAGLNTWPEVETSTAYNADYMYSVWRDCYEGNLGWLGSGYTAGDAWGCVGVWFAGRWKSADANTYIQAVQDWKNSKIWTDPGFISYR